MLRVARLQQSIRYTVSDGDHDPCHTTITLNLNKLVTSLFIAIVEFGYIDDFQNRPALVIVLRAHRTPSVKFIIENSI